MHAEQIIDAQADLTWRCGQEGFRRYLAIILGGMEQQSDARNLAGIHPGFRPTREGLLSQVLPENLGVQTRVADAYRVTEDMCLVVQRAADGLDGTDRFHHELAPSRMGFARFERGLPILDARGRLMTAHWCMWGAMRDFHGNPGTYVCWFNDHIEEPDDYAQDYFGNQPPNERRRLFEVIGRWGFIGVDVLSDGQDLGPAITELRPDIAAQIYANGDTPTAHTNVARYVHALWLLLNQTIAEVAEEHVRRTVARNARRMGLPGRVSVIDLRRIDNAGREAGESLVEWARRWLVKGHWRWQPYGERAGIDHEHSYAEAGWEDGYSSRPCTHPGCASALRRIFINGYVKGPTDKPLVVPDKVYVLRR